MAEQSRRPQLGNSMWAFEVSGTPGMPGSPLSTLVSSNALLSRSVRRGGGAASRPRTPLALSSAGSTAGYHTKSFNIPDELARYNNPEGEGEIVGVKNVRTATLTLRINPLLPWGDHYNVTSFAEGTAQRLVAEEAAVLYGNSSLSTIGGFFYTLYREKERGKGRGVANMSKPFVLPRGSVWKAVPKRSPYYCPAVYIADPIRMLTPTQVLMYTQFANDHLTIALPLCPAAIGESDDDFVECTPQPTRELFNNSSDGAERSAQQCMMDDSPGQWSPRQPALSTPVAMQPSASTRGHVERCSQGQLSRGRFHYSEEESGRRVRPTRATHDASIAVHAGGQRDRLPAPVQSTATALDSDNDDFETDPPIRRLNAASVTRRTCRGSTSSTPVANTLQAPCTSLDNNDDDFVDLTDTCSMSRMRMQEEREMMRLDKEWLQVSLAYDALRSNGEIAVAQESDLDAACAAAASRNSATRFWGMLKSLRMTVTQPEEALAWDALLRRRDQRRGLPESVVNDELVTVLLHTDMEMWAISQVEAFFLEQSHPDWQKWDMIENLTSVDFAHASAQEIYSTLVGTPLEETFSVDVISGMLTRIAMWKSKEARMSNDALETALVNSYWRKEEVWRAYQVCNFRTRILGDYRAALARFAPERLRVKPGTELQELRGLLFKSKEAKTPFPPLKVTYEYEMGDVAFAELDTQDCGGLTRRFLGQCWMQFWNDHGVYGSVFEIAEGGHTRSVKALCRPQLNKLRTSNLEIFGLLCFLLPMYGQQVDRPMTMSTLALVCGWHPKEDNVATLDKFEGDYQAMKPQLFTVLNALLRAKTIEDQAAAKSAILGDCEYSEIFCAVSKLSVKAADAGAESAFAIHAHDILRQQIRKTMFDGPRLAGECMFAGFKYAIQSCVACRLTPKPAANSISATLATLSPEMIAPVFGAETGVDAEDFLNSCHFSSLPVVLENRFRQVVRGMTQAARFKLYKFITDSEYFSFDRIIVTVNPEWDKNRLPEASTCFRSMTIPAYDSDETMATKLAYAACHSEYGNA